MKPSAKGTRELPGVWRLRLPLYWPGVPHGNAWALKAGDGIVLVDTGIHVPPDDERPGSWAELEYAMSQVGLSLSQVSLLVCTHAHSDHYGQAAPIVEATGCELWMHPDIAHQTNAAKDPEAALRRRFEKGVRHGVPEERMRAFVDGRRDLGSGVAAVIEPHRELKPGVIIETDLGPWTVHETPGHAPSHVCLHQADRGLLITGDHLLGKVSIFYDPGYSPDPVGEYLGSLDYLDGLEASLAFAGHGRPFRHVPERIAAFRDRIVSHREATAAFLGDEPKTAFELLPPEVSPEYAPWAIAQLVTYLEHLELTGRAASADHDDVVRWTRV